MQQIQVVEELSLVATFRVKGLPLEMYPQIGDEMSDGVIINESNQKDYSTPLYRNDDECEISSLENIEFCSMEVNGNNEVEIAISRLFENVSEEEVLNYARNIAVLSIFDRVSNESNTIEVELRDYEIN